MHFFFPDVTNRMCLYLLEDLVLGFTPDVQLKSEGKGGYKCIITAYLVPTTIWVSNVAP